MIKEIKGKFIFDKSENRKIQKKKKKIHLDEVLNCVKQAAVG